MDIDSFSDPAPEVQKEVIPDVAAGPLVAAADSAVDSAVPQPFHPHEEASPEFVKELELTVHRGEDPVEDAPLLEIREKLPEGQAPSPSQAAFNKSFGTSYRGELLSVGCRATGVGGGGSEILTLWKSPTLVDETGEGVSKKCLARMFEALERSPVPPRRGLLQVRDRCSSRRIKKVRYFLQFFLLYIFLLCFCGFISRLFRV
jgi:hypothetical protein